MVSTVPRIDIRSVCVALLLSLFFALPAGAQFGGFRRMAGAVGACGGGAVGGQRRLGDKFAQAAIAKDNLDGEAAAKVRRSYQIGMAALLCGNGVVLAGTVYNTLSRRDREAREREMRLGLEDANASSRTYVLPESKLMGRLETDAIEIENTRQCRRQVDFLAKDDEPATVRFCRPSDTSTFEIELQ
jgi:hypothetical protein